MTQHKVGTREEWLAARKELLEREKELTRRSDELARERLELPWVRIDEDYTFDTDEGTKTLADLFDGRSQLVVYHFMFGPEYTKGGCPTCSSMADAFDGLLPHLNNHDVTFLAISRAPLEKLQAYKRRMGWRFPWVSSSGSDFNFDYGVSFTERPAAGKRRIQLPLVRSGAAAGGRQRPTRRAGGRDGDGRGGVHGRGAGHERVRARGRRRLPHLLRLRPRR